MSERGVNCPFYGYAMYTSISVSARPFVLLASGGNECALVTESHAPCIMGAPVGDLDRAQIDWRECPRVKDMRLG